MSDHHHVWIITVYEVRCQRCGDRRYYDDMTNAKDVARAHRCGDTDE